MKREKRGGARGGGGGGRGRERGREIVKMLFEKKVVLNTL